MNCPKCGKNSGAATEGDCDYKFANDRTGNAARLLFAKRRDLAQVSISVIFWTFALPLPAFVSSGGTFDTSDGKNHSVMGFYCFVSGAFGVPFGIVSWYANLFLIAFWIFSLSGNVDYLKRAGLLLTGLIIALTSLTVTDLPWGANIGPCQAALGTYFWILSFVLPLFAGMTFWAFREPVAR